MLPDDDRQVLSLLAAVGRPELMTDERLCSCAARAKHPEVFYDLIHELAPGETTTERIALCQAAQIPCTPIVDIEDLPEDEHLRAVGMFEPHQHPTEGATRLVRSPIGWSSSPVSIRRHSPAVRSTAWKCCVTSDAPSPKSPR
jgi:crotonobetainyl-CoA:carnitine CoA-transferase CaiB-like acyl-CoA transferase